MYFYFISSFRLYNFYRNWDRICGIFIYENDSSIDIRSNLWTSRSIYLNNLSLRSLAFETNPWMRFASWGRFKIKFVYWFKKVKKVTYNFLIISTFCGNYSLTKFSMSSLVLSALGLIKSEYRGKITLKAFSEAISIC